MVEYLYGHEETLLPWTCERIEGMVFDADARAIGVAREGEIAACVVFDQFTTSGCQMAVASDLSRRWLSREFIVRVFTYPFLQLGLRRVGCLVSVDNRPSLKLARGLGFKQEGIIRQAGAQAQDMIAFGMLRKECRFLPKESKIKEDIVTFSK